MSFAGLGIDMGPAEDVRQIGRRQRAQTMSFTSDELPASLNQYNSIRLQSAAPLRRSTTASAAIDCNNRKASGPSDIIFNDDDKIVMEERIAPSRNKRLSMAVAAMKDQDWNSGSTDNIVDMYISDASSPLQQEPLGSVSRLNGSSSLKRVQTVRRQKSQPVFDGVSQGSSERIHTISTGVFDRKPNRQDLRDMGRSRSAMDIRPASMIDIPLVSSLGRSKEIRRSTSRLSMREEPLFPEKRLQRSVTLDGRGNVERDSNGLVPDGFGGFVEPDRAAMQSKPASPDIQSDPVPEVGAMSMEELGPRIVKEAIQAEHTRKRSATISHSSQSSLSASFNPNLLRVGSFYAPDGSETARLDEDGRLSRIGSSYGSSSESGEYSAPSEASFPSSGSSIQSRSQSQSGPKPQFMSSPGKIFQNEPSLIITASQPDGSKIHKSVSMRSKRGFQGLEGAERGEAMVTLECGLERFGRGEQIAPAPLPQQSELIDTIPSRRPLSMRWSNQMNPIKLRRHLSAPGLSSIEGALLDSEGSKIPSTSNTGSSSLVRQNTLLSAASNSTRKVKELNHLLAPSTRTESRIAADGATSIGQPLKRSSTLGPGAIPPAILEQGKSGKGRVDVDLILESDLVVEGGYLRGRLEINVRKGFDQDGALMLTQPKVRVVGFEELLNDDTRHVFYHHATVIDGSPQVGSGPSQPYVLHGSLSHSPEADNRKPLSCFSSLADFEGYSKAKSGNHSIPFAMEMPVGKGAKGCYRGRNAIVRYIVIGSVKLKSENGNNRSIAHFYRHIDLFPYLNPAVVLSSSARALQASASKGLFLGGSGKVHLTASLHRSTWVAGQRVYVNVKIDNETNKKVKNLTLALVRTVTLFRPRPELDMTKTRSRFDDSNEDYIDPDACTTSTSRKKITEEVLEMGQKGSKGTVTARGWWTGVEAGVAVEFSHNMKLPPDALSITRGRHVEVLYSIKVSVSSSLSSDVSIELPVRIINFVSLDPPPLKSLSTKVTRNWSRDNHQRNAMSESESSMRGMEALRSPHLLNTGLGLEPVPNNSQPYNDNVLGLPMSQLQPSHSNGSSQLQIPGASSRNLQHQKSLDFINHAIRSATARKTRSNEPSPMGLGINLDENRTPPGNNYSSAASSSSESAVSSNNTMMQVHPSCLPYEHQVQAHQASGKNARGPALYTHPVNLPISIESIGDEDDFDSDEEDYGQGNQTLNLNDESVAEVDFVIGSAHIDGGESSPQFEDRTQLPDHLGARNNVVYSNESDDSTSTIASRGEIQEYMEEGQVSVSLEDDRTPLAQSPSKFPTSYLPRSTSSSSMLQSQSRNDESDDGYMTSSTSSSRRSVVRTEAPINSNLTRTSTIIRGPNRSRPISPSKQAPSPVKSALKMSTSGLPFSSDGAPPYHLNITAPLRSRENTHVIKAKSSVITTTKNGNTFSGRCGGQGWQSSASSSSGYNGSSSECYSNDEMSSDSSNSPATSASLSTPEGEHRDVLDDIYHKYANEEIIMQPVDVTPKKSTSIKALFAIPISVSNPTLTRSSSIHNIGGSTIVVPSVRDKIALLESRKQALQNLTGRIAPPSPMGTPKKNTPTKSSNGNAGYLQRSDSIASQVASPAEYLRNTPSISSFKAPLLTSSYSRAT